jgi:hypothetical protein
MKRSIAAVLLGLVALGTLSASAIRPETLKVLINKEVTTKDGLRIAFVDLIEDSRCPKDVDCVWAGNARIKVRISPATGSAESYELNTTTSPRSIVIDGYEFKFTALTPEPASNIRIRKDGYTATFVVTRRN